MINAKCMIKLLEVETFGPLANDLSMNSVRGNILLLRKKENALRKVMTAELAQYVGKLANLEELLRKERQDTHILYTYIALLENKLYEPYLSEVSSKQRQVFPLSSLQRYPSSVPNVMLRQRSVT
jgi:hypothetical protein